MPDVSPTKWHLAHVTWLFETFILKPVFADYSEFHPDFNYLFNSYYAAYATVGSRHARPEVLRKSAYLIADAFRAPRMGIQCPGIAGNRKLNYERQTQSRDVVQRVAKRRRIPCPEDIAIDPLAPQRHPIRPPAIGIFDIAMPVCEPDAQPIGKNAVILVGWLAETIIVRPVTRTGRRRPHSLGVDEN